MLVGPPSEMPHSALGFGRGHHGHEVLHALLERRDLAHRIREPRAALVEQDEPGERRQAVQHARHDGHLPVVLHVRDEAGDEHQIEGPVAHHLVGDVHVAALRVAGLRGHENLV